MFSWTAPLILDKGTVLKVINVPKESWNNMEELLLEELEVFKVRKYKKQIAYSYEHLYTESIFSENT